MIEMIEVGGVVILIAQELQCRNLTKKLFTQERINADLILKNQLYVKRIEYLENNPITTKKIDQKELKKQNSYTPDYDYELENFDLYKRQRGGKKFNL